MISIFRQYQLFIYLFFVHKYGELVVLFNFMMKLCKMNHFVQNRDVEGILWSVAHCKAFFTLLVCFE